MNSTTSSYKDLFAHHTLDRITGHPTYESLTTLKKQLQANAASVPSTLGGGANGHLGLVLTPQQYHFISLRPFIRPNHPGVLTIPPNTPADEVNRLRHNHKVNTDLFQLTHSVEKTLIQQLISAIHSTYVEELRNTTTGLIDKPLSEILTHLITNYGQVETSEYNQKYFELLKHQYDPDRPIDEIFTKIVEFITLAEASHMPITMEQALNIGCEIIRQCGVFAESLKRWHKTPITEKTWTNFKTHFREEHKAYRSTLPTTTKTTQYNANMIAHQVANQLWERAQEVEQQPPQEQMPPTYPGQGQATPPPLPYHHQPPQPHFQPPQFMPPQQQYMPPQQFQQANAMIRDTTMNTLFDHIKDLTKTVNEMKLQQKHITNNGRHNTNQDNVNGGRPSREKKEKKYCWTHGLCGHDGFNCRAQAPGHNPYATKNNRLGGSTKRTGQPKLPNNPQNQNQYYTQHTQQHPFPPQQQMFHPPTQTGNQQAPPPGYGFPPPGQYYGNYRT